MYDDDTLCVETRLPWQQLRAAADTAYDFHTQFQASDAGRLLHAIHQIPAPASGPLATRSHTHRTHTIDPVSELHRIHAATPLAARLATALHHLESHYDSPAAQLLHGDWAETTRTGLPITRPPRPRPRPRRRAPARQRAPPAHRTPLPR